MKRFQAKLNSQSGVSILLALVFLLICLTVGAVTLTAATANAGQLSHIRDEQRNYETVAAAVTLLRDELEGGKFIITTTVVSYSDIDLSNEYPIPETNVEANDSLKPLLEGNAQSVYEGKETSLKTLTIEAAEMAAVTATFQMHDDYSITVQASLDGASPMELNYLPDKFREAPPDISSVEKEKPIEVIGEDGSKTEVMVPYTETTTVTTQTYTWENGVITRGVAP